MSLSDRPMRQMARAPRKAATAVLFADVDRSGSPGCAVGVSHQGEVLFEEAFGLADVERGIPLSAASIFDATS